LEDIGKKQLEDADLNGDQVVDIKDIALFMERLEDYVFIDLNKDGKEDQLDIDAAKRLIDIVNQEITFSAEELARLTGEPIRSADNLAAPMQSMHDLQQLSAGIRSLALELTRIANDMRLLASGPRTGFGEIELPSVQPGSSIMPGKVNPVMFEMLNQVCYQVLGQDHAVALMTQAGQLELNVMMPALGSALFDAMDWLTNAVRATTEKGLRGLKVNHERCRELAHTSVGLATLLNTSIGYGAAAEVAKESERSGRPVREIVAEKGLMSTEEFDRLVERAAIEGNIISPRR